MLITVLQPKGGNGKTTLANAISRSLDAHYATNDPINSYIVVENHPRYLKKITDTEINQDTVVFDAGGFIDKSMTSLIKSSDIVLIPVEFSNSAITSLWQIYAEIKEMNPNIHVIANKIEKDKDFNEIVDALEDIGVDSILRLRKSRIFEPLLENNKSMEDYHNDNMLRNRYKDGIFEDYFKILDLVKKYKY